MIQFSNEWACIVRSTGGYCYSLIFVATTEADAAAYATPVAEEGGYVFLGAFPIEFGLKRGWRGNMVQAEFNTCSLAMLDAWKQHKLAAPRKAPVVPPEIWSTTPFDPQRAWAATSAMCRSPL